MITIRFFKTPTWLDRNMTVMLPEDAVEAIPGVGVRIRWRMRREGEREEATEPCYLTFPWESIEGIKHQVPLVIAADAAPKCATQDKRR